MDTQEFRYDGSERFDIAVAKKTISNTFDKKESKKEIEDNVEWLSDYQEKLYASESRSVIIVFQAMDAAGKDGTIERVVKGTNPAGVEVHSFKKPTDDERLRDFLWRVNAKVPRKGKIAVFNRSHYEEALVTRVHPQFILGQNIPGINSTEDINESFWKERFEAIKTFEKHLTSTGTVIIKFFLNVSREEQKSRMMDRLNEQEKHWKFNIRDLYERQEWEQYMKYYEEAI
ncbi:MAG: polyphosphate kinase 2 family protein, partial [Flavobacteriales bacterium]|nr:polyphosphate kinase 2 family protein [Flavobacteriales bacterium]